ncbi:DUF378 domain-containing protein [Patescibacteria group bacterium]|nr:DUF378 domain-containing protein [Patescibacteria group bacterium]MBU1702964.1 DUF378 domain-containing protein [Patescibacteria group bacterium]
MCWIVCILVFVGALNWGLTGLGMLMGSNLNVVNLLLGAWPTIEEIVYLLVGIAGLVFGYTVLVSKCCCCMGKCEK